MPKLYLGVDGGGTNCRMRLADETLHPLAEAEIEARANLQVENGDSAYRAVKALVATVFEKAGLDPADAASAYACLGMAGGRMTTDCEAFEKRDWPFAALKVFDDIDIAHAGALGGEEGGAIIVGTGSAAMSIVGGRRYQVGGWGFHIGDQMSGAILGRELARYAVEAEDGLVEASPLTRAVIAKLGGDNQAVMAWAFASDMDLKLLSRDGSEGCDDALIGRAPGAYGSLMPLLFEHYEAGDPVARRMIDIQLGYTDNYVRWFRSHGATRIAVTGGFGRRLFPILRERYGDLVMLPLHEPLHGALLLARQIFGDA